MATTSDSQGPHRHWRLSKSKLTSFEQCPKRLWLQVHRPAEAAADDMAEARFEAGREVGAAACALCPDGIMIDAVPDLEAALTTTASLIASGTQWPLFEATFRHDDVLVRADILQPRQPGWSLAEVKSSTSVKPYHLAEVATQAWTIEGAGVPLSAVTVRHLNRDFVLEEEGAYAGLFTDADVAELVAPLVEDRAEVAAAARAVLDGAEPDQPMGAQCTDPFDCEFRDYCRRGTIQPQWPITLLPKTGRRLANEWAAQGVTELLDVPAGALTNPLHARIHQATSSGQPFHDCQAARDATRAWAFPRSWLDFETIAFAVPRWLGTRPWQQVPFQFSVHVERDSGALSHHEFLSLDGSDPRQALASALVAAIPPTGAVIAYNASFERMCITQLAAACPQLGQQLDHIAARLVDLWPVARACWYHRDQRGSWSIKALLPTVADGPGYAGLDIAEGSAAQLAYLEAIQPGTSDARRQQLGQALRDYCQRDTEAMLTVYRRLVVDS